VLLAKIRTEVQNRCGLCSFLLKRPRIPYRGGDEAGEYLRAVIALRMPFPELVKFPEREPADLALLDPEVEARDRPYLSPG
jgi:hypothetical protein